MYTRKPTNIGRSIKSEQKNKQSATNQPTTSSKIAQFSQRIGMGGHEQVMRVRIGTILNLHLRRCILALLVNGNLCPKMGI